MKLAKAGRLVKQALDLAADALVDPPKVPVEKSAMREALENRQRAIEEAFRVLDHPEGGASVKLERVKKILAPYR